MKAMYKHKECQVLGPPRVREVPVGKGETMKIELLPIQFVTREGLTKRAWVKKTKVTTEEE
jgi:hypothetical protein